MKSARYILLALFAAVASAVWAESGKRECRFPEGPSYPGNIFEPPAWPVTDLETYARGRLGVIRPTYDHFYLFIAYRALAGLPNTQEDIERLRPRDPCWYTAARGFYGYEPTAEDKFQSALSEWQSARAKVGALPEVPTIGARSSHPEYNFVEFLNCHADAFRNAATVLDNRLSAYGQSPEVLDWVKAQDQVFANCAAPSDLPADAPASAPEWLRLDRAYQKAAAHFYAKRYDETVKEFDAIAMNADSPWREIAPYLAARAVIRSATTQQPPQGGPLDPRKLAEAESRLKAILDKPIKDELRQDVKRLLQFVQLRTRPDEVLRRLDDQLTASELPDSIGQDVTDYWMAYTKGEGEYSPLPFASWLSALRQGSDAAGAIARWRETGALPWLIAALQSAGPDFPKLDGLLADAEKIPPGSPAYLTVRYHLARLIGDQAKAIRIIDDVLELRDGSVGIQDSNAFRHIGLARAATIAEFARFAPRTSAMSIYGIPPTIDSDSVRIFNEGLPLDELAQIAAMKKLPDKFRRELTLVVWTRAFVLERWDVLRRFTPRIKRLIPEAGRLVDDMLRGSDGNRRRAFGAMLIARYPGMVGNMSDKITYSVNLDDFARANVRRSMAQDGERENWWCGFPSGVFWAQMGYGTVTDEPPPKLLSPRSIEALRVERQKLRETPNATDYLSGLVMAWARTIPRDPRLPEALHMLVRSSRGGCIRQPDSGAMFRHLHTYFPGNRWTKTTKVHYQ